MKAVRVHELAGPGSLVVESVPDPVPQPGEVAVRVHRAAFNRRDIFITQGLYPGIELPKILGSDACGTVAALGEGVQGPKVGLPVVIDPTIDWGENPRVWERKSTVLGMPRDGTFAQFVAVPARNVYPKPGGLSDDEAAAIPLAGLTAYRAVFTRGKLQRGETVLITGVGGGVQSFVLLYAKHAGARAIVTSGSDEKLERAKALGADVAINYKTSPEWQKEVRAATGAGPDLIVDSVGGETLARCLGVAKYGGRVVIYGGTTGNASIRPYDIFWKQLDIHGTSMGSPHDFRAMLELFETGQLKPVIDEVVPMDQAAAAAERVATATQFGKVVLAID
jgi:NADPH:quinone reductase-like Zn-dependent oxidoreductase